MQSPKVSVMLFAFLISCVFAFSCVEDDVEYDFDADVAQEQIIPGCVRYVDQDAEPDGDARSWETAVRSLEEAVDRIPEEEDDAECEIWVKEGMALPEEFEVVDGVGELDDIQFYTGFRGNEKSRVVPSRENVHSSILGSRLETELDNSTITNSRNAAAQNTYGLLSEPETAAPDDIFDDAIPTADTGDGFFVIWGTPDPLLLLTPVPANYQWGIMNDGQLNFLLATPSAPITVMMMNYLGNIGMGTTSPTSRLEINGNDNNGSTGTLEIVSGTQRLLLDGNEIDAVGTSNLYFNHNSHKKTCINTSGGRVAIGSTNTNPASVLSVTGQVTIFDDLGGKTHFGSGSGFDNKNYLTFGLNGKMKIRTFDGSEYDNIGYWNKNGLNVDGRLRAEEVLVEMFTADYVFGENYDLMTLDEVEKYIDENSHLPGMPSAADVDEWGVSLGDHQARLLQKIEELTLHSIEQNKKIEVMMAEIEQLKDSVEGCN